MKQNYKLIVFDVDGRSGISLKKILKGISKMIKKAKREFHRDGAVHTWITYSIDITRQGKYVTVESIMDDGRAANIFSVIGKGSYIIRIKYITEVRTTTTDETSDIKYIIRDNLDPVMKDKKTVVINPDKTSPGVLTGIDSHYYERDYPVTVTIYGLYKIKDPDIKKLAPMRISSSTLISSMNCVAERVKEHLLNATHGGKLTGKKIQQ